MAIFTNKSKKVTTIVAVIILCVVIGLVAFNGIFGKPWGHNNFATENTLDVVRIVLESPGEEPLVLERKKHDKWFMNEHISVNEISIRDLLEVVSTVTIKHPVSRLMQAEVNQELDQGGTIVTIYQRRPLINIFNFLRLFPITKKERKFHILGGHKPLGNDTYMRMFGYETPFVVHVPGITVPLVRFFNTSVSYWQNPVVLNLRAGEIAFVEVNYAGTEPHKYRIENHHGQHVLKIDGKTIERDSISSVNLTRFVNSFSDLYFEKKLTATDSITSIEKIVTPSIMELEVMDMEGNVKKLGFFRKMKDESTHDPDRFFLVVDNEYLAIASYFVFNRIMKPYNYFIN